MQQLLGFHCHGSPLAARQITAFVGAQRVVQRIGVSAVKRRGCRLNAQLNTCSIAVPAVKDVTLVNRDWQRFVVAAFAHVRHKALKVFFAGLGKDVELVAL